MTAGSQANSAQALVRLTTQVLPVWARHLESSRAQSEAAVSEMLAAFGELVSHLDLALHAAQIERLYKGFQYQDRISQMMKLLHDDMGRLHHALNHADTELAPKQWLARLEAGYVMAEQRQQHGDSAGVADVDRGDDTTFF